MKTQLYIKRDIVFIKNLTFRSTNCHIYDHIEKNSIFLNNLKKFTFGNHFLLRYLFIDEHVTFLVDWFKQLHLVNSVFKNIQITNYGNIDINNIDIYNFLYLNKLIADNDINFEHNHKAISFFVKQTKIVYYPLDYNNETNKVDNYITKNINLHYTKNIEKFIEILDGFEHPLQDISLEQFIVSAFNYLCFLTEISEIIDEWINNGANGTKADVLSCIKEGDFLLSEILGDKNKPNIAYGFIECLMQSSYCPPFLSDTKTEDIIVSVRCLVNEYRLGDKI